VSVPTQIRPSALEDHETGSRPDLEIRTRSEDGGLSVVLVESKVGSSVASHISLDAIHTSV
jgi:hypothetical protein